MHCCEDMIFYLSCGVILAALAHLAQHSKSQVSYGRHMGHSSKARMVPAKLAWFLQELPAFLVPVLLLLTSHRPTSLGRFLLLWTFCLHYFQRTFVYSLLTRGRPFPLSVMLPAALFCSVNGFLQGHHLLHCTYLEDGWSAGYHFKTGLVLFYLGMAINIHSDYVLRNLRKPGEVVYRIPRGGLFEYVSCANYLGEIVEWFGYAIATWSFPSFAFAVFTLFFIGPRAFYHHRYYQDHFEDYPRSRKALIPFIF